MNEEKKKQQLLDEFRAEYENACDYLYYGIGFWKWYDTCNYMSLDDAKAVWKLAFDHMGNDDW